MSGPLTGLKVIEMPAIGPVPFCGMLLADLGADVLRLEPVDLKNPAGIAMVLDLIGKADVVLEGFRPGVMERLGLGPDVALKRNPGLVYGRMTGWGQDGPLAQAAGHDINYIALTGALAPLARLVVRPSRRSIGLVMLAAARSISPWACWRRCSSARTAARARWWIAPWWMVPPR